MSGDNKVKLSELIGFTPKQLEATGVADKHRFTLYGGAGGGGKSYWLRWYPIRWLMRMYDKTKLPGITAGLFCEDYPSLKDRHVTKMATEFPAWLGTLSNSSLHGLSFVLNKQFGGGILALRNLDDPSKYYSSEFALVAVDELTKNLEGMFDLLRFRMRWPGIGDTRFIAGTNPGSIGHEWVKNKWILGVHGENEQEPDQYAFVQAMVKDNPHVHPDYVIALKSLPEKMRKALLEGDWDIFEGQFFTEFSKATHVVEPFKIPESWKKVRSIDISGRNGITSCHWYAVDYDGQIWCYREYYYGASVNNPLTGKKYGEGRDSDEHAKKIAQLSEGEEYAYTVIDSSAFDKLGMPETTSEIYMKYGVTGLVPSSKNRVMGWDIMHQYLRYTDEQPPRLRFFSNCVNIIRTIPLLIHDEKNPEDADTTGEDHAPDECRYVLQTFREAKSPKPLNIVERRLKELRDAEESASYNFNYRKVYK